MDDIQFYLTESTITRLLEELHDIQKGEILWDVLLGVVGMFSIALWAFDHFIRIELI
jgi:hypothetical protein